MIPGLASIPIKVGPTRFRRLAKPPGSAIEKRRKGEGERVDRLPRSCGKAQRAKRPLLFCDQNITSEEEESPSLSINSSFFEEPKSSEVAVGLNLSSGPRVKDIDRLHNVAQNCWKAAVIRHLLASCVPGFFERSSTINDLTEI